MDSNVDFSLYQIDVILLNKRYLYINFFIVNYLIIWYLIYLYIVLIQVLNVYFASGLEINGILT